MGQVSQAHCHFQLRWLPWSQPRHRSTSQRHPEQTNPTPAPAPDLGPYHSLRHSLCPRQLAPQRQHSHPHQHLQQHSHTLSNRPPQEASVTAGPTEAAAIEDTTSVPASIHERATKPLPSWTTNYVAPNTSIVRPTDIHPTEPEGWLPLLTMFQKAHHIFL